MFFNVCLSLWRHVIVCSPESVSTRIVLLSIPSVYDSSMHVSPCAKASISSVKNGFVCCLLSANSSVLVANTNINVMVVCPCVFRYSLCSTFRRKPEELELLSVSSRLSLQQKLTHTHTNTLTYLQFFWALCSWSFYKKYFNGFQVRA